MTAPIWADDELGAPLGGGLYALLGGRNPYRISDSLFATTPDLLITHRVALTDYILSFGSEDKECLVTSQNLGQILNRPRRRFARRIDLLLSAIARETRHSLSQSVRLTLTPNDRLTNDICRVTSTYDAGELRAFVLALAEKGWLVTTDRVTDDRYKVRITTEGLLRLDELDAFPLMSGNAFVAMWFSKETEDAYANGIAPAIIELGYEPVRIDNKEHANKIDDEIIFEIRKSRFVIADFSCGPDGHRGGVYFEAGFAHALGRPVIWTVRSSDLERVHFDTRQFNHIVWENADELRNRLVRRIGHLVGPFTP